MDHRHIVLFVLGAVFGFLVAKKQEAPECSCSPDEWQLLRELYQCEKKLSEYEVWRAVTLRPF